jgi:TRAP-type C4-dicarboxylate transport system permease small subunit
MAEKKTEQHPKKRRLTIEIVTQMLTLATTGFGLVAALAWNSLIQNFFQNYLAKWIPNGGDILSQLMYAVVVTALAVLVTLQLSKLKDRLEN